MLRGLKKFAAGNSTTNLAAGSGAQGASAIGAAKAADRPVDEVPPEKAAPQQQQEARKSAEPEQRTEASSSSQAIVAREEPSGNGWAYEEVWAYIDSLGLTKTPGEEHIIRFLSDCITSSPLPAPWAMHRDGDGRVFYGNSATAETTWQHPLEEIIRELSGVCRVCCTLSRRMREKSIADLREAWEVQAKQDFALWYSVKDSSTGKDYFCNSQTGLTMWEHPAEVLLPGHFLKLRGADRLVDEEYLQVLAAMGGTENEGMGQTWNSMKRTLDSSISTKASDLKDDAHQAMKEELASTWSSLRAAKEDAAKVKADFEKLKERFEEAKRTAEDQEMKRSKAEAKLEEEQKRLQLALAECAELKKQAEAKEASNAFDNKEDPHKAIKEELASTAVELKTAREDAAKVKSEHEALQSRFEEAKRSAEDVELKRSEAEAKLQEEQRRLERVMAECESLKQGQEEAHKSSNSAQQAQQAIQQELATATKELETAKANAAQVKTELDALKERFEQAQRNAAELEQQCSQTEAKLTSEQQRLQSVTTECEAWKQQAMATKDGSEQGMKVLEETLKAELDAERERVATLQQEIAEKSSNQAAEAKLTAEQAKLIAEQARTQSAKEECEIWKTQATASKDGSSESVKKLQETLLADLQAERRQVAELQHEIAEKTSKQAADATAAQLLQDELKRRKEAEIELRTTMQALQEELHQEKSKAADAMSKYAAVSKVREAAVQEVGSVESQTRDLREQLEAQLSEERQKAQQLEAKYEALRDAHETAVRVFAENVGKHEDASPSQRTLPVQGDAIQAALREALEKEKAVREGLLRDQERLEQSTKSLQEQMQKVHTVASELEAKVHQSKSQLEAAENSRPAIPPPQPSQIAGEASLADQALQRQIESARQAEKDLEDRAMAAKASLEEERGRVEKLKAEYTLLLMNQQEMVQTSQKTLETKLEEISAQMREMRGVLSQPQQTPHTEDALATKLAQVSAANARLENAVAISGTPSSKARPPPEESKAPTLPVPQEVLAKKVPDPLKDRTFISKLNGKELKIREYNGKMWARTNDAVLIGQKTRHLMLESLAARQQTKLYKEMIQEFDASAVGQKAKLSRAKVAVSSLNASLRDQVEEARRELDQLEDKAKRLGRASHS